MAPITNKFTRWWMGPERLQQYEKQEREREAQEALQGVGADVQRLLMAGGQGAQGSIRDTVDTGDGTEMPRVGPSYEDMLRMQANAKGVGDSVLTLPEIRARMQGLQAQYGDVEAVQKAGETVEGLHAQDAIRRYQMAGAPALAASEGIDKDKLTDMALSNPNMSPEEIQRIAEGQVLLEQGGNTRRGVGEMFLEGNVSDRADVFRNTLQLSDEAQADEENEFGRSSVGAALAFTKANPQLVERLKETVQMMRETGNYDEIALKATEDTAESDVRAAQQMLARELFKPETARRTGEETLGIKTQTAAATAAAGVAGKESAEQRILGGETVSGLEPIPGVRQTEQSINKVKDVKPQMDALRKSLADLLSAYEKNGWQPIGPQSADYESKARLAQLLSKETALFNLGVLNGPDLDILEQVVTNPGAFKSGMQIARYGKKHIGQRLNNVLDLVDYRAGQFYETHGMRTQEARSTQGPRKAQTKTSSVVPQISTAEDYNALPSGTLYVDPEGRRRRKP